MFLGLQWYWWLGIAAVVLVSAPLKIWFLKRWNRRQREQTGTPSLLLWVERSKIIEIIQSAQIGVQVGKLKQ